MSENYPNNDLKWQTVPWKDGVIGQTEQFFLERFNFHPMWARSLGTILVSTALGNMEKFELNDEWGSVYANLLFTYIGRSGLAIKTPPIKMVKKILYDYNKEVICPTDFNRHSFAEWVEGTNGKVNGENKRKTIPSHPINICVADEASRILGDIKFDPNKKTLREFISKMWDNEIEGKYTRKMQIEGNINVYFSMLAASSRDFYRLLNKDFFIQGTGNRILWIVEDKFVPPKLNPDKFFYQYAQDNKFVEFRNSIIDGMRKISSAYGIWIDKDASELWINYANKLFENIVTLKDNEAEYSAKVALNVLKLSMCYAASRFNIDPNNMIMISLEDMQTAIEDGKEYLRMWKLAMVQWSMRNEDENEDRMKTSKYDVDKFVAIAIENGGTICISEIMKLGYPDRVKIGERLNLGVSMELFECVYFPPNESNLSKEEYDHYDKLCNGNLPMVWRVTKKGREKRS